MRSRLSQELLDNLVAAWARLDRARPRDEAHVPLLLEALDERVRWAVRIDHLACLPERRPASDMTTFPLGAAVADAAELRT